MHSHIFLFKIKFPAYNIHKLTSNTILLIVRPSTYSHPVPSTILGRWKETALDVENRTWLNWPACRCDPILKRVPPWCHWNLRMDTIYVFDLNASYQLSYEVTYDDIRTFHLRMDRFRTKYVRKWHLPLNVSQFDWRTKLSNQPRPWILTNGFCCLSNCPKFTVVLVIFSYDHEIMKMASQRQTWEEFHVSIAVMDMDLCK